MSDISPVNPSSSLGRVTGSKPAPSAPQGSESPARGSDQVELSETARLLSKLASVPEVRSDLIARVRAEIEAGTYETGAKIDQAIEALAEDL